MLFGGILQIPSTATEVRAAQIRVSGAGPSMKGKLLCPRWSSGGKNHSRLKSEQGLLTESPGKTFIGPTPRCSLIVAGMCQAVLLFDSGEWALAGCGASGRR